MEVCSIVRRKPLIGNFVHGLICLSIHTSGHGPGNVTEVISKAKPGLLKTSRNYMTLSFLFTPEFPKCQARSRQGSHALGSHQEGKSRNSTLAPRVSNNNFCSEIALVHKCINSALGLVWARGSILLAWHPACFGLTPSLPKGGQVAGWQVVWWNWACTPTRD